MALPALAAKIDQPRQAWAMIILALLFFRNALYYIIMNLIPQSLFF